MWILLQPRDYLNSFLLYFMIAAAVIGILGSNPTVILTPFSGFTVGNSMLFPTLFITVACGAVSGFHSLIASGTTSKQLSNEGDAKMIGYGGMLIECVLAVIALLCVGSLTTDGNYTEVAAAPATVFATAIAGFFTKMGLGEKAASIAFTVISLAVSAFCLTSLDTCCRLGRFTFQEFFTPEEGEKTSMQKTLTNKYVATVINLGMAALLCGAGYAKIWPLFGACNQLVSVPALMAAAVFMKRMSRNHKMFIVPMFFMAAASLFQLVLSFRNNVATIMAGGASLAAPIMQCIIIVPVFVLAIALLWEGCKALFGKETAKN